MLNEIINISNVSSNIYNCPLFCIPGSSIRNRDEELLDVLQADHFDQDDTKALW